MRIDSRDAEQSVRDAERRTEDARQNLENAKLSLAKLQKPTDALTLLQTEHALSQSRRDLEDVQKPPDALAVQQAEHALANAQESQQDAHDAQDRTREDGFTAMSNAFIDLPGIMTGLEDMMFKTTIQNGQSNINWYYDQAKLNQTQERYDSISASFRSVETELPRTRSAYDANLASYTSISRNSPHDSVFVEIENTYETLRLVVETIKTARTFVATAKDMMALREAAIPSTMTTHQSALDTFTATANKHLAALLAAVQGDENARQSIAAAGRSLQEKIDSLEKLNKGAEEADIQSARERVAEREASLAQLKDGADDLDIAAQNLSIEKFERALLDAQDTYDDAREKLADYAVHAPFDGTLAAIDAGLGDSVSPSTALGVLITFDKLAEISLNEVDVAAVAVGQKATITFDALPDFSVVGSVAEVDAIGTNSQGVVTFTVTLALDTDDVRIKPGMSVSASIITQAKADALLIPNEAVKTDGDASYVEVAESEAGPIQRRTILTG
ncbi:MAG: HlyD family efflux transporter periplasmic adaptor subunit, partial [Patescibacteria group bacterium]